MCVYMYATYVSSCVHMCLHVSTCVLYQHFGYLLTFYTIHVLSGVSYMYGLLAHSMVSHHCVLPIFPLLQPFAGALFCTLCYVFSYVFPLSVPFSFNDLLMY